ncbi:MAG: DinB family protein [Phycisphaerales bacterium]
MPLLDTMLDHAAMLEAWTRCSAEDVPDARWAEQPGGLTNHPAWVFGHLAYAMDNLTRLLGVDVPRDEAWYAPFVGGSTPTAERSAYPSRDELLEAFSDSCSRLRRAVRAGGEAMLERPVEDEQIRAYFPTLGRWATHVLLAEGAFHTGQLSAWRRAQGMPSVFENEDNLAKMLHASGAS